MTSLDRAGLPSIPSTAWETKVPGSPLDYAMPYQLDHWGSEKAAMLTSPLIVPLIASFHQKKKSFFCVSLQIWAVYAGSEDQVHSYMKSLPRE